jgi:superfamily II RNA helicase
MAHLYIHDPDVPAETQPDDIVEITPYPLDNFQKYACSAIEKNEMVLVTAKTGSGKTLVGEYQIYRSIKKGKKVYYTTPIKSLSNQKFNDLTQKFEKKFGVKVGIMTGDIKYRPEADIVIMTTEILRNLLYKRGTSTEKIGITASLSVEDLDAVIFDEAHYINDPDRGYVWEESIILMPPGINIVLLSATIADAVSMGRWITDIIERPLHLISTTYRVVPLSHHVVAPVFWTTGCESPLLTIMDNTEIYQKLVYSEWYQKMTSVAPKPVKTKDRERPVVSTAAKPREPKPVSSIYKMNHLVRYLKDRDLLPALLFVFSRKECEEYAGKIEGSLISAYETSNVDAVIDYQLSRHRKILEKIPQYYVIRDLLKRGIAFHHSGLLPILKEIVEIVFSMGLVKVLFCTETFAVGINMPTRTVVFLDLKKPGDAGYFRPLRIDEYTQMAGRAGRRGLDEKGVVIYMPMRDPITPAEMSGILTGSREALNSRMNFHYEFILRTWLTDYSDDFRSKIVRMSYWTRQRQVAVERLKAQLDVTEAQIKVVTPSMEELEYVKEADRLRELIPISRRQARKEYEDALSRIPVPGKHIGDWRRLVAECDGLKRDIIEMSKPLSLDAKIAFLDAAGFCRGSPVATIATEINESHGIVVPKVYLSGALAKLKAEDLCIYFACFIKDAGVTPAPNIDEIAGFSEELNEVLYETDDIVTELMEIERKVGAISPGDYWDLSTGWIEVMMVWFRGDPVGKICQDYGIYEGNLMRTVLRIANIVEEVRNMATYFEHLDFVAKLGETEKHLMREFIIDSLYIRPSN